MCIHRIRNLYRKTIKMNESLFKSRKIQTPISNVAEFFSKKGTFTNKPLANRESQKKD